MQAPEPFVLRHDLHVVVVAAAVLALGAWVNARGGERVRTVEQDRLSLSVPADWLAEPAAGGEQLVLRGEDAVTRLELRAGARPSPMVTVDSSLELERGQRYGALYQRLANGRVTVGGREWQRTVYGYAFKPSSTHAPRLATAVEYAVADGSRLYVATLHAPDEARAAELERSVLRTLVLK